MMVIILKVLGKVLGFSTTGKVLGFSTTQETTVNSHIWGKFFRR